MDELIDECQKAVKKSSIIERVVMIKPFLKWAGGKYKLLNVIKSKFPNSISGKYIEPFLGAGAIALNVECSSIIVNDFNADLILVWKLLKSLRNDFINECKNLFIPENNSSEEYYKLRNEFNNTNDELRKASLFVYLNRHCFNGLCRYNSSGNFNTPKGSYTKVYFPEEEFKNSLKQVGKFKIYNKDFRIIFDKVSEGDVVYCDPPYFPISQSANFDTYISGGFSLKDHLDLAKCASDASKKGAVVIISNHYNWYSHQIYSDMFNGKISKIEVTRTISSKIDNRESVEEIISVFY